MTVMQMFSCNLLPATVLRIHLIADLFGAPSTRWSNRGKYRLYILLCHRLIAYKCIASALSLSLPGRIPSFELIGTKCHSLGLGLTRSQYDTSSSRLSHFLTGRLAQSVWRVWPFRVTRPQTDSEMLLRAYLYHHVTF